MRTGESLHSPVSVSGEGFAPRPGRELRARYGDLEASLAAGQAPCCLRFRF
jgi:hypothetical protein